MRRSLPTVVAVLLWAALAHAAGDVGNPTPTASSRGAEIRPGQALGEWSRYPPLQDLDLAGYSVSNISGLTFSTAHPRQKVFFGDHWSRYQAEYQPKGEEDKVPGILLEEFGGPVDTYRNGFFIDNRWAEGDTGTGWNFYGYLGIRPMNPKMGQRTYPSKAAYEAGFPFRASDVSTRLDFARLRHLGFTTKETDIHTVGVEQYKTWLYALEPSVTEMVLEMNTSEKLDFNLAIDDKATTSHRHFNLNPTQSYWEDFDADGTGSRIGLSQNMFSATMSGAAASTRLQLAATELSAHAGTITLSANRINAPNHLIPRTFSHTVQWSSPTSSDDNMWVWYSTHACTITGVTAYLTGGTDVDLLVYNGTHLVTDPKLTVEKGQWTRAPILVNTTVPAGSPIRVDTASIKGTPKRIFVQVDFTTP